jgi:hypothetical protein
MGMIASERSVPTVVPLGQWHGCCSLLQCDGNIMMMVMMWPPTMVARSCHRGTLG